MLHVRYCYAYASCACVLLVLCACTQLGNAELADTINRFMVPDFVVLTMESRIVEVSSASFEEFDAAKRKVGRATAALAGGLAAPFY